jgi:type VI secretion system protein ImpE
VTAEELFRAGKLDEAIESLGGELRSNPADVQRRIFLFELLCFAGEYERAGKQLDVLGSGSKQAQMGVLVYQAALHADRTRQGMFAAASYPRGAAPSAGGTLNGRSFQSITDADPRIGARLEVFAAGQYLWIPFAHISAITLGAPQRLRDLLWTPAVVRTGAGFKGTELGEVLLPVLAPLSWQDADAAVRLGRVTEWVGLEDGTAVPLGQKLLLVDGEELPLLEVRELEITAAAHKVS